MTCWRCGRIDHADWCSMPGGCTHCGWSPCRWWCLGEADRPMLGLYRYGVTGLHETVRELTGSPSDMHHHLDKLAGVRLRADVDDEIARENHAIAAIEEAIEKRDYRPPECDFCSASAMDVCSLCDRLACEDDFVVDGICIECESEVLS